MATDTTFYIFVQPSISLACKTITNFETFANSERRNYPYSYVTENNKKDTGGAYKCLSDALFRGILFKQANTNECALAIKKCEYISVGY